jgi:NADPH2:quinone reductase
MKAILCRHFGPPESLMLEDVPSPKAGPGQLVVSVAAAGANFPDILIIQGKYQFKPKLPFSPGSELAGTVKEVGPGVTGFRVGDTVMAQTLWGAFAEEVAVDVTKATRLPSGVDLTLAAGFGLTYATSHHALRDRAQLQRGETLLVLGAAGGVGLAAVELGARMGARVIAAASTAEKLETCRSYGAAHLINYEREDLREAIRKHTDDRGVDVVYDPVGDKYAEPAVRGLAWQGRYLVVGFAGGKIPRIPLNLVLLKGAAIVGVFWGDFARRDPKANEANMQILLGWLTDGTLRPLVSATYPLARAAQALIDLANRAVQGKAVIVTG